MKKEYWKFGKKGQEYYTEKITKNNGEYSIKEDLMPEEVPEEARGKEYFIIEETDSTMKNKDTKDFPTIISTEELAKHLYDSLDLDKKPEMVNHPKHYGGDTTYECIKVLHNWMNKDEYFGFCKGNALKYLCRAGQKDETKQELQKAVWYINKMIEACNEN